ncbi:tRNA epoxyqueuosine(34) reductase QueG [Serpentinicella sp. ANB-PHB4]|uniref:tRNA epoxyqueuosine(34) reductase QueG n=1 Tax=Serpentinicella sp. ANB-PHB4 TaxID=3074076 RepID=UPI002865DF07|nr:tRNA epoxyqueuosine(34) reductase QueG [Serpentinicella sp. ANB-PHB4]MDR5658944.1 tRNA epoxyqueuosine(34) reductase QueG [Serpentinicella sp. ANB-PHB4]
MMKEKLKEFCKALNIEKVGIAPIGPYNDLYKRLMMRKDNEQLTGFEELDINLRTDPRLTMANVKSIIVCLFPYYVGEKEEANLSKYTYAQDYHMIVRDKLNEIGTYLTNNIANFEYMSFVDTGPLVDRYLAYLASLGYFGINSHLITDDYGSYFFIGYILNNYDFKPDQPMDKTCYQCKTCIKKCPGQIILGNFDIDPRKCRAYITQIKGDLTEDEIEILKKTDMVFGCDICQDVCPHNRGVKHTEIEAFKNDLIYSLKHEDLEGISNKEFMRRYKNRAFSWRGKKTILRNFNYIKGHIDK